MTKNNANSPKQVIAKGTFPPEDFFAGFVAGFFFPEAACLDAPDLDVDLELVLPELFLVSHRYLLMPSDLTQR